MSEIAGGTSNARQAAKDLNCDPIRSDDLARKSVYEVRQNKDAIDDLLRPKSYQRRIDSATIHLGRHVIRQSLLAFEYLEHRSKASFRSMSLPDGTERSGHAPRTERSGHAPRTERSGHAPRTGRSGHAPRTGRSGRAPRTERSAIGFREYIMSERGDVPGWVLVVLMTTGLVTAIWAVAAPKLNAILKNSLDSMNNIR